MGVAVPALLETARNHGVYILDDMENNEAFVGAPLQVLQKPTIGELQSTPQATFVLPKDTQQEVAWLDTGIIIWLPAAVQHLVGLATTTLQACTKSGLDRLYQQQYYCWRN